MNTPKRVVVEYTDGTRHSAPFDSLSIGTREELSSLGRERGTPRSYVMLEWRDGWKELVAVDGRAREVLRYYTVERVEEVGRLSVEVPGEHPELLLVRRLPGGIARLLFVDGEEVQLYTLEEKAVVREGGKVEHIMYDKKRPNFRREDGPAAALRYDAVLREVETELQKQGLTAPALSQMDDGEREQVYKTLARALGLRGMERQEDVYGFLAIVLRKLTHAD